MSGINKGEQDWRKPFRYREPFGQRCQGEEEQVCSGYWKEAIVLREVRIKRSVLLQNDCQRVSDCRLVLLSRAEEESRTPSFRALGPVES